MRPFSRENYTETVILNTKPFGKRFDPSEIGAYFRGCYNKPAALRRENEALAVQQSETGPQVYPWEVLDSVTTLIHWASLARGQQSRETTHL